MSKCSMKKKMESIKFESTTEGLTYTIRDIYVDVHEDSFTTGEGKFVNSYDMNHDASGKSFNSLSDLLYFLATKVLYDDKFKNGNMWMALDYENSRLRITTSKLVDEDNDAVSDEDINLWKDGKIKLYSASYDVILTVAYNTVPKDVVDAAVNELGIENYIE